MPFYLGYHKSMRYLTLGMVLFPLGASCMAMCPMVQFLPSSLSALVSLLFVLLSKCHLHPSLLQALVLHFQHLLIPQTKYDLIQTSLLSSPHKASEVTLAYPCELYLNSTFIEVLKATSFFLIPPVPSPPTFYQPPNLWDIICMVTDTLYSFDITIIITAVIIVIISHKWGHAISCVMGHEQKYVTSGWEQRKVRHERTPFVLSSCCRQWPAMIQKGKPPPVGVPHYLWRIESH